MRGSVALVSPALERVSALAYLCCSRLLARTVQFPSTASTGMGLAHRSHHGAYVIQPISLHALNSQP